MTLEINTGPSTESKDQKKKPANAVIERHAVEKNTWSKIDSMTLAYWFKFFFPPRDGSTS